MTGAWCRGRRIGGGDEGRQFFVVGVTFRSMGGVCVCVGGGHGWWSKICSRRVVVQWLVYGSCVGVVVVCQCVSIVGGGP